MDSNAWPSTVGFLVCFSICLLGPELLLPAVADQAESQFPAIFVFGDSLLDAGNNEKLITFAKANRPPYGRDSVGHRPTGKFCNGPLSVDVIASRAGLPFPPAYLLAGENIMYGASFASAGAGILNSTGVPLGQRIDFFQQVTYFAELHQRLIAKIGNEKASFMVSRSLFVVFIGNNDYLINYFGAPSVKSPLQRKYSPAAFLDLLLSVFEKRILELYSMGARKFGIVSLPPIGCIPFELLLSRSKGGQCISKINDQAQNFNAGLQLLLTQLRLSYSDAHFIYLNTYDSLSQIINDPTSYGFVYANRACCGLGPYGGVPCWNPLSSVCKNASEYVFWDFAHPTAALNAVMANRFWDGSAPDVHPINLKELAAL